MLDVVPAPRCWGAGYSGNHFPRFVKPHGFGKVTDMTSNTQGAYPLDPATIAGLFRLELGDVVATNIVDDTADYGYISDAGITALMAAYPDLPDMALGKAMISMANQMIAAAQNIQVDTIKINTIEKAQLMLNSANAMIANAISGAASSWFHVVQTEALSDSRNAWPQGQPWNLLNGRSGQPGYVGPSGF